MLAFLGKILNSHSATFHVHPGVTGTGEFNAGGNPVMTTGISSIRSMGERKYSKSLHATRTRISSTLMCHLAHLHTLQVGAKVGPDKLGTLVRVGSTQINSDRLGLSHIIISEIFLNEFASVHQIDSFNHYPFLLRHVI